MSKRSRIAAALAVPLLATAALVAVPSSASAISRVNCTNDSYLWVFSNQTTCWANAGAINVNLYSTIGYSSGNNAGYLLRVSTFTYFSKYTSNSWPSQQITRVRIY